MKFRRNIHCIFGIEKKGSVTMFFKESCKPFVQGQTLQGKPYALFHYRDVVPPQTFLHSHNFYELYFFVSGKADYQIADVIYPLAPADILLISPGQKHQPLNVSDRVPYERVILWLNAEFLKKIDADVGSEGILRIFEDVRSNRCCKLKMKPTHRQMVTQSLQFLLREYQKEDYAADLVVRSEITLLLILLNRVAHTRDEEPCSTASLMRDVQKYLDMHYTETISLDEIAAQFFISPSHLVHAFKQYTGISVHRYVTDKRLELACTLLSGGASPGDACIHSNMGDYSNFYRAFKTRYGVSPNKFIEQAKLSNNKKLK